MPVLPGHVRCLVTGTARTISFKRRGRSTANCVFVAVLNAADAQGRDNDEAAAIIREKVGLEYFPHPIIQRKAFRNAAAAGLSVAECRPADEKAIQ